MSKLDFYPILTPREMIERGAFGGSYFGEENLSGDTQYCQLFKYHFDGLDRSLYEGEKYSPKKNKYKVRSGMDYKYWCDMKWMHEDDPYGWFEWYCKYSSGRRHPDDDRQIRRWQDFCGVNGRWRKRIYKMMIETGNWNVSPRIQQSLLHWGYEVNQQDFEQYCKLEGKQWNLTEYKNWFKGQYDDPDWCSYAGMPSPRAYE